MTSLTGQHVAPAMARSESAMADAAGRDYRPMLCGGALLAADCLAVAASTLLAVFAMGLLRHGFGVLAHPLSLSVSLGRVPLDLVVLYVLVIAYLARKGRYGERTPFWTATGLVVGGALCAVAAELTLGLLAHETSDRALAALALLAFAGVAPALGQLARRGLAAVGLWTLAVLVVGDGANAIEAELALGSDKSLGYRFVGRVDPASLMAGLAMDPAAPRLAALLQRHHASRLLIALDSDDRPQRRLVECALRERVPFAVAPAPHAFPAFACKSTRVFSHNLLFLSFDEQLSSPAMRLAKAGFDILVAGVLIVAVSPLLLALALACRLDGGPAFFAHRRIGAQGRPFRCFKFRTMMVGADQMLRDALARDPALAAEWSANQKLVDDPRVTPVGRLLRKTSLDELPQLLNVLRLEMSLVGPRPIVESEVSLYGVHIAQYYAVRPGLTGLWQVSGRNDTTYERRVQLDVWYVNNWSIWHDIAVLLKTLPAVLRHQEVH